jgi:hypothetical protein
VAVRRSDAETAKAVMLEEARRLTGAEISVEIQTAAS